MRFAWSITDHFIFIVSEVMSKRSDDSVAFVFGCCPNFNRKSVAPL